MPQDFNSAFDTLFKDITKEELGLGDTTGRLSFERQRSNLLKHFERAFMKDEEAQQSIVDVVFFRSSGEAQAARDDLDRRLEEAISPSREGRRRSLEHRARNEIGRGAPPARRQQKRQEFIDRGLRAFDESQAPLLADKRAELEANILKEEQRATKELRRDLIMQAQDADVQTQRQRRPERQGGIGSAVTARLARL